LASVLTFYLASTLTSFLRFFLAFYLTFYPTFCPAFSLAWVRVQVAPTASKAGDVGFGFRRPPQHPGLAMWGSGPGALHCILGSGWQKEKAEVEQREEGEGRREGGKEGRKEGVAPLLKSRDPHLAGGAQLS
jgi:hypothetical protein